jgi:hypothetical protein
MVTTFADLIGTWPRAPERNGRRPTSIATFAADVGVAYSHAQIMRYRNSIGADYWPSVVAAAKRRGVTLTHEDLMKMRELARGGVKARPSRVSMGGANAA